MKKDKDFYYDGPVKDSGRSLEELDRDIKKEKARIMQGNRTNHWLK